MRDPITLDTAEAQIRLRIRERESSFLRVLARGVFGVPSSPYRQLLGAAGCTYADVQALIIQRGLEPALASLRDAGVYITFEEFKRRAPLVRHGREFPVAASAFDNPFVRRYYEVETGGSTGRRARAVIDIEQSRVAATRQAVVCAAHGVLDAPVIVWRSGLPGAAGINAILSAARRGNVPRRWFVPLSTADLPSWKNRLAMRAFIRTGRLARVRLPRPEVVPLERASLVAEAAADLVRLEGSCVVSTPVSLATRVAQTAVDNGIDLRGVTFMGAGEPPTEAKVVRIRAAGARHVPNYYMAEAGAIGLACANPSETGEVHFCSDALAVVTRRREMPGTGLPVDALCYTSLLPTARKLLINVESDDFGTFGRRPCGCAIERLGFVDHLRGIGSFSKLNAEGVTLVGSDMVRVLQEELPRRFGGGPLDYQLQEEEDEHGRTRLTLVVSPAVGDLDEDALVGTVLSAINRAQDGADLASAHWRRAGTLRVRREAPAWTRDGKLLPLRTLRSLRQAEP